MTRMPLRQAFLLNPTVSLPKGTIASAVEMAALQPFTRDVQTTTVKAYSGGAKFLNGDVLMARITPSLENGKTSIYRADHGDTSAAFGSTEFTVIRGREGISDTAFAYYVFTSPAVREHAIASMNGSSGRQRVQQDSLGSYEIDLPLIDEQRAIAAMLGALDDKIESNRCALSITLNLASALYENALSVRSKTVTVADVAEFHNRRRIPLSSREREARHGVVPYYGATGVFGYVDDALFDEVLVLVGEDGSVVRSDGGPVLQYIWGPAWINNHAHPLTGRGVSSELLYLALDRVEVRPIVTGAVQPKVSMGNLKSVSMEIPEGVSLANLEREIEPLFQRYRAHSDEQFRLVELRNALLPDLLSGRIRVAAENVT